MQIFPNAVAHLSALSLKKCVCVCACVLPFAYWYVAGQLEFWKDY